MPGELTLSVNVALSEVPVNIFPLLDDTDFKSIEASVVYNAAGMALKWNFVTQAGAYAQTSVTPTTAGVYDWANQGNGMYSIEIPASAGASINNDTEGFGWFTGVATGVLPWRGPIIKFEAALIEPGRKKFFNVSSPTGTVNSMPDAVPGNSLGLILVNQALPVTSFLSDSTPFAGADIATIKAKTNLIPTAPASTTNITTVGAVSGSVGSVTGTLTALPLTKNTAGQYIPFRMLKATNVLIGQDGTPTITRALDGATSWSATTGTLAAFNDATGRIIFAPSAADLNAGLCSFKCALSGAVTQIVDVYTHV